MACYNPVAGFLDYDEFAKNGKKIYKIAGRYKPDYFEIDPNVIKIPCGRCLGCRLDYTRTWADRMILELASMEEKKAIFVTLTYDNDHVTFFQGDDLEDSPLGYTLVKKDVQDFFKRLRKKYNCRYYLSGEYGPKTFRPHYHAIIFGIGLQDFKDLTVIGRNELGQLYYTSDWFTRCWSNGFTTLSDVSYKTCAYVARYVMKKAFGVLFDDGRQREFVLMSRRPGIGYNYYKDHKEEALNAHIYLPSLMADRPIYIPKYFLDKVKVDFPDEYDLIKEQRVAAAADREFLKLANTDLSYIDMLELEYNAMLNKTKILLNRKDV